MGAKCLRAYDEFDEEGLPGYAKRYLQENRLAAAQCLPDTSTRCESSSRNGSAMESMSRTPSRSKQIAVRPIFGMSGEGDEEIIDPDRGDEVDARAPGRILPREARALSRPRLSWQLKAPPTLVPVTLHVYNIGNASVGRVLNRILKPLGTGAFHCGVEVYGCEWSYSDTTTGTGDGVFPSKPMCCEGHDFAESVLMGKTTTPEEEVARLIKLMNKEWPVHEYDTLKRNCCHFSNEFCQRLGVGPIPSWVMNLAGAGAAIAATGDLTCCRQMAIQTCCCGASDPGQRGNVEVVDVVEQMPVLPRNASR